MTVVAGCKLSRDELITVLKANEGKLRALGIISVSMFGSRLRGDNRPDSDLDLLVDYDKSRKFSLLDLAHVENYLIDVIGCDVQLTTHDSLHDSSYAVIKSNSSTVF